METFPLVPSGKISKKDLRALIGKGMFAASAEVRRDPLSGSSRAGG
jgi:hypothetical protein